MVCPLSALRILRRKGGDSISCKGSRRRDRRTDRLLFPLSIFPPHLRSSPNIHDGALDWQSFLELSKTFRAGRNLRLVVASCRIVNNLSLSLPRSSAAKAVICSQAECTVPSFRSSHSNLQSSAKSHAARRTGCLNDRCRKLAEKCWMSNYRIVQEVQSIPIQRLQGFRPSVS